MRTRKAYIRALLMCATAACSTTTIAAEGPLTEFRIPAGDLAAALRAYGLQSGEQISFQDDTVRQLRTPAITGRYSPSAALDLILGSSGIHATRSENGVILLQGPPVSAPPAWVADKAKRRMKMNEINVK